MNLNDELSAAVSDLSDGELVFLRQVLLHGRDRQAEDGKPKSAHVLACLVALLRQEIRRRQGEVKQLERDLYAGPDRVVGGWGSDDLS